MGSKDKDSGKTMEMSAGMEGGGSWRDDNSCYWISVLKIMGIHCLTETGEGQEIF